VEHPTIIITIIIITIIITITTTAAAAAATTSIVIARAQPSGEGGRVRRESKRFAGQNERSASTASGGAQAQYARHHRTE
jgi:hypothetical protein